MVIRIVCPLFLRMDIKSDIADMGDFSDEEEGQWEEVEPPKVVHTNVRTEFVV